MKVVTVHSCRFCGGVCTRTEVYEYGGHKRCADAHLVRIRA